MARVTGTSDRPCNPLGKMTILVLVFCCFGLVFGQSWPQDPFKRVRLGAHLKFCPVDQL